jgi:hypothetical protein
MSTASEVSACTPWDICGWYEWTGPNAWSRIGPQDKQYENGPKNRYQPNQCRLRQNLA